MRSRRAQTLSGIFGLGLNSESQPYALKDGECRACLNVVSTVRGSIRKRDGCQTFATGAATLTSLYGSSNPNFLIAAGGTVVYKITTGGVLSTIKTGMTNGALWEWINAPANGGQGPLYGVNGTDAQQWDGAAATTSAWTAASGTFPTGAKYLTYAGNRVFAAGMTAYAGVADPSSTVVFSNLAAPRDWPAANVVQFDPNDGEVITGIGRVGPYVLVFKPSKAWVVYDLDTGANRSLGQNMGCVAHRSIAESPAGTFFLGKDAIYRTDGSGVAAISRGRIGPTIKSIVQANRAKAAAQFFNGHYYLAVSAAGATNNYVIDYDLGLDSFWLHSNTEADLAAWEGDGTPRLYGANSGAGMTIDKMYVADVTSDNGTAFTSSWSSPYYAFGASNERKRVWGIHFEGSGRIQASVAKDFSVSTALAKDVDFSVLAGSSETFGAGTVLFGAGTEAFGVAVSVAHARILTPGVARTWSVVYGNSATVNFEIDSISFELAHKNRKAVAA